MACIRNLSTARSNLIKRHYNPRFTYILHDDDNQNQEPNYYRKQVISPTNYIQQKSVITNSIGFASLEANCSQFAGACFVRYMSTTTTTSAAAVAEKIDMAAEVLVDGATQAAVNEVAVAAADSVNEVAVAAADSFLPVAALQHFIDAVHNFTGLNWWASIVVTTLIIRTATLPLLINQLKATSKLSILSPRLEEIKQKMEYQGMDPTAVTEGQKQMQKLFKEHGVSPFTPLKGLFIQGPVFISFFLAVSNMAEKMPSFKTGGAYWFIDLTTPDSLYIFPVLTALTFLITVECNMQEGMEGNRSAGTMKNVSRALAVASVPFTMSFPKAIFCYWVTSNLFSLVYGLVLKAPGVKKFLGVPEVPVAPPTTATKSSFDLFSALKQFTKARHEQPRLPPPVEPPKLFEHKKSSSSVIGERIKSLEKEVKGRKKNKKRRRRNGF